MDAAHAYFVSTFAANGHRLRPWIAIAVAMLALTVAALVAPAPRTRAT